VELGKFRTMKAVRQVQYVQTALDSVELRMVLNRALDDDEIAKVEERARAALGYPFRIILVPVAQIPRGPTGKFEEFLSAVEAR